MTQQITLSNGTKLTDNEIKVLNGFMDDDYVNDNGWTDESASAWSDCMFDFCQDVNQRSFPGIVASLNRKEIMVTSGTGRDAAIMLTDLGREACRAIIDAGRCTSERALDHLEWVKGQEAEQEAADTKTETPETTTDEPTIETTPVTDGHISTNFINFQENSNPCKRGADGRKLSPTGKPSRVINNLIAMLGKTVRLYNRYWKIVDCDAFEATLVCVDDPDHHNHILFGRIVVLTKGQIQWLLDWEYGDIELNLDMAYVCGWEPSAVVRASRQQGLGDCIEHINYIHVGSGRKLTHVKESNFWAGYSLALGCVCDGDVDYDDVIDRNKMMNPHITTAKALAANSCS